ncbi:MAG: heme A synthase [Microcystaceae cyanobacterium]
MTEFVIQSSKSLREAPSTIQTWIRRLVWKITIATLLLMVVGSATRVMNAGLACPDWPLCYGQLIPSQQMNLQVFLEWFHRLDASLIGLSTLLLVGLSVWFRAKLPSWLPWASLFALGLIVFQGVLGGLTVTEMLRFDIVTAHLGTALLFLGTLIVIALCLYPSQGEIKPQKLTWIALTSAILIYCQCLLGGLVGSRWAVHQCLNLSLNHLCAVLNSHLLGVIPPTLAILTLGLMTWRTSALSMGLRRLAYTAVGCVVLQILLGVGTFRLHLQVEPLTIAHHTIGATLWGILVAFTVLSIRTEIQTVGASEH